MRLAAEKNLRGWEILPHQRHGRRTGLPAASFRFVTAGQSFTGSTALGLVRNSSVFFGLMDGFC